MTGSRDKSQIGACPAITRVSMTVVRRRKSQRTTTMGGANGNRSYNPLNTADMKRTCASFRLAHCVSPARSCSRLSSNWSSRASYALRNPPGKRCSGAEVFCIYLTGLVYAAAGHGMSFTPASFSIVCWCVLRGIFCHFVKINVVFTYRNYATRRFDAFAAAPKPKRGKQETQGLLYGCGDFL